VLKGTAFESVFNSIVNLLKTNKVTHSDICTQLCVTFLKQIKNAHKLNIPMQMIKPLHSAGAGAKTPTSTPVELNAKSQ
jgi:hypothetical protein